MKCNVYGVIVAPNGLTEVLNAVKAISDHAGIDRSSEKYGDALWFRSNSLDLLSVACSDRIEHTLSGHVAGSIAEVGVTVRKVSETLECAHIKHFFDIYDEDQRIVERVGNW